MSWDLRQFDRSLGPAEIGGYAHSALAEGRLFLHIMNTGIHNMPKDRLVGYVHDMASSIGDLVVSDANPEEHVEQITTADISPAYHTDHPYRKEPSRFIGIFAVNAPGIKTQIDLLHYNQVPTQLEDPEEQKIMQRMRVPATFRHGKEEATGVPLARKEHRIRFDAELLGRNLRGWGREVTDILDWSTVGAAERVTLSAADVLFFNNHELLHRQYRPPSRPLRSARVRIQDLR